MEGGGGDEGSSGGGGGISSSDIGPLGGSKEVEEWALSLRGGRSSLLPPHQNLQGHCSPIPPAFDAQEHLASGKPSGC